MHVRVEIRPERCCCDEAPAAWATAEATTTAAAQRHLDRTAVVAQVRVAGARKRPSGISNRPTDDARVACPDVYRDIHPCARIDRAKIAGDKRRERCATGAGRHATPHDRTRVREAEFCGYWVAYGDICRCIR